MAPGADSPEDPMEQQQHEQGDPEVPPMMQPLDTVLHCPEAAQVEYQVILDKTDGTCLGADVCFYDGKSLLIEGVRNDGGAFKKWNLSNPEKFVNRCDRIIEVNGLRNDSLRMLEECNKRQLLKLVVVRALQDVHTVARDFPDGQGRFEALHNANLEKSLMTGHFENTTSSGGHTRYEGSFLNHPHSQQPTPSGEGVRTNPDGSVYAGQWKDGFPHGHGEWKAPEPSCECYLGDWARGKKHGFGQLKFENGDMYEGDFANGKFQDRGKYTYANGDEFMGIWENGLKSQGTFYFKDGRVSTRKWKNGALISCQDFDSRRKSYQPTINKSQVHDPARNTYGARTMSTMLSPRGIQVD